MRTMIVRTALVAAALTALLVSMLVGPAGAAHPDAKAMIRNGSGTVLAVVKLSDTDEGTAVKVAASNLSPGFHGFHVHAAGACTGDFTSAGGHYNPGSVTHGAHAGDLPVLLINPDGTGHSRFTTQAFDVDDVVGRAFIIHAAADNYANVPVGTGDTQYTPNTVGTTNATATGLTANTGNAGARTGCGVIEAA